MSEISAVEFGRVLGHLEAIQAEIRDLKTRTMFRLDDLESRVETIEKHSAERSFPSIARSCASLPASTIERKSFSFSPLSSNPSFSKFLSISFTLSSPLKAIPGLFKKLKRRKIETHRELD